MVAWIQLREERFTKASILIQHWTHFKSQDSNSWIESNCPVTLIINDSKIAAKPHKIKNNK